MLFPSSLVGCETLNGFVGHHAVRVDIRLVVAYHFASHTIASVMSEVMTPAMTRSKIAGQFSFMCGTTRPSTL